MTCCNRRDIRNKVCKKFTYFIEKINNSCRSSRKGGGQGRRTGRVDSHLHSNYHYETQGRTCLKAERRMLPVEIDCNTTRGRKKPKPNLQIICHMVSDPLSFHLFNQSQEQISREKSKEGKHKIKT